jgi:predicted MFS family arabinose efflux permease
MPIWRIDRVFVILMKSVSLLIVGRVVGGLTSGSLSTAQAAVIDISTPENKATNIGYILFAISLGFMVGPVLAGTLSDSTLVSWFEITTPLYFAAALSLINIIFLQLVFKETFIPKERKSIKLFSGLTVFISAFTVPELRRLTFAFLFLQLGWSTFVQFFGLFLTLQYHFTANQVGIFMGCVGAGFTLAFCYLLNIVTKLFPLKKIALTAVSLMSLMMLAIVTINNQLSAWLISVPAATGLAISFTVLTTMFSNTVGSEKQGWIMGLTGAIGAFSFGITGLGAGFIAILGASAPIWVAFILLTISALVISTLTHVNKN